MKTKNERNGERRHDSELDNRETRDTAKAEDTADIGEVIDLLMDIRDELQVNNMRTRPMTRKEAAEYLGVHFDTLLKWSREGKVAYIRLGDGAKAPLRYLKKDLDALVSGCRIRSSEEMGSMLQ